jgi:ligand-binding sensor domain-containing protein
MKILSLLFTFLMLTEISSGQIPLNFNHLTSDDGLTSNNTSCLLKDSRGFIWIGTDAGLNRFDGNYVKTYTHIIGDSTTLINNNILTLFEDDLNRIWIGTSLGLSILEPESSSFTNFIMLPMDDDSIDVSNGVLSINQFRGKIWIATSDKIIVTPSDTLNFVIAVEDLTPKSIKPPYFLPNRTITTANGIWFLASTGPLCLVDGQTLYNWDHNPEDWPIFNNKWIATLLNDGDSVIYYTTFQFPGIYAYKLATKVLDSIPLLNISEIWTLSLIRLNNDELLGSTWRNGIFTLNTNSGASKFYAPVMGNPRSLCSNNIGQLLLDDQKTVFLATDRGLDYFNPAQPQLKIVDLSNIILENTNVDIVEDANGKLWLGTENNGLYAYSPGTGIIEQFPLPGKYNRIWSMHFEHDRLILGSDGGLATFSTTSNQFKSLAGQLPDTIQKLTTHSSTFIFKDALGSHWIAQFPYNLLKYNFQTGEFISYSPKDPVNHLPGMGTITCGYLDEHGSLWLGYKDGDVSQINTFDNSIRNFKVKFNSDYGIVSDISSLGCDGNGNLWIGTTQTGLFKYNIALDSFTSYDTRDNLSSDMLGSLAIDHNNNIWINASNGLNKFEPSTENVTVYNTSDGFLHDQFNQSSSFLARDGTFYMVCGNYLISMSTDESEINTNLPKVVFLSYKKSGEEFAISSPYESLCFNASDRMITFEFFGINFIDPAKTRYAYKLDGFDEDWQTGSQPSATYTSLEAGKYTLRIKTTNKLGEVWSPETTMNIRVYGPLWLRWWFLALCFSFCILVAFSIYKYRLAHFRKIQAIRNKISKDLHDEIGSTLGSISIFSKAAEMMKADQYDEILSTVRLIGTNARNAMENMSDIVWAIQPSNDTLKDLMDRLQLYAFKMLEAKNITLQFDIPEDMYDAKLTLHQRRNIYLILCEAIHNVAKYSNATHCIVTAEIIHNKINLQIKDDGLGFDPVSKSLGGNGFINMKQRAQELNAVFTVFTEKLRGTILTLQFKNS